MELGQLDSLSDDANGWLDAFDDVLSELDDLISRLGKAKTRDTRISALAALAPHDIQYSAEHLIQQCLVNQFVEVQASGGEHEVELDHLVREGGNQNGCYLIEFPHLTLAIFDHLDDRPFRVKRLQPFVDAVTRLDAVAVIDVLKKCKKILEDQHKQIQDLQKLLDPLVKDNSQWVFHCTLANLGTTPFVLDTENAELQIDGANIRRTKLAATLILREEKRAVLLETPLVLQPGTSVDLGVVTEQHQGKINGSDYLRTAYSSKDATAIAVLTTRGGTWNRQAKLKSKSIPFCALDK